MENENIKKLEQILSTWNAPESFSDPQFKLKLKKAESEFKALFPDLLKYLTSRPLLSRDLEYINNLNKCISENKEFVYKLYDPIERILSINRRTKYKEAFSDPKFKELNEKQRTVINLRYGFSEGRAYTLKEIGQRLSLSGERIRQIEAKALQKLRGYISQSE